MSWSRYRKSRQWAVRLLISLLIFFTLLGIILLLSAELSELKIVQLLQRIDHIVLHWPTIALAELGKPYVVAIKAIVISVLLFVYRYRLEAYLVFSTLLIDLTNLLLKKQIARDRPSSDLVDVLKEASNYGFPSGHTVNFIVFFGFLFVILPIIKEIGSIWRTVFSLLLVILIFIGPFSRVYGGMHWPSDILGGGVFSIIFLGLLFLIYFYLKKRKLKS